MSSTGTDTSRDGHLRVAYLIVTRSFPGLFKQVAYDRALTDALPDVTWDHFTILDEVEDDPSFQQLPPLCRGVFGRKLYAWLWLLRNARRYDFVIVRHMEFDPFALIFGWFVRNRILVHHSKEVIELQLIRKGWKGKAASMLERFSGRVAVRTARGLVGVTREVAEYQRDFHNLPPKHPVGFFPNGVEVDTIEPLADERPEDAIHMAFLCGSFAPWHGLDLILDALESHVNQAEVEPVYLHLIGRLNPDQENRVKQINAIAGTDYIVAHGRKNQDEYRQIMARCQIGLGTLAMQRIQMEEGATLKVRELLAMGLPLYSGHTDTVLPPEFPYYVKGPVTMSDIIAFARDMQAVSRDTVRDASRPYVDKRKWVEGLLDFLKSIRS